MLLFSLLVAGSFSFGRSIANDIDPVALTTARFAFASAILTAILLASGQFRLIHFRQPLRFIFLGGAFVIYFVFMFEALKTATPVSTSATFTTLPLLAALLDRLISGRKSRPVIWAALLIGASGALWVVFRGSLSNFLGMNIGRGEAIFFAGTMAHAVYAVMVPKLRRGEPVFATTLGMTVAGTLVLALLFWPRIAATDWGGLSLRIWGVLAYLTVFASVATFSLIIYASSRLPSAKVTAYTFLTPFWVALIETVLGNALPGLFVLLGGLPILLALVILFFEPS